MTTNINKLTPRKRNNFIWLVLIGLGTVILWNIPGGKLVFYPFTILGTWFHEMSHGLTAMILGGNFTRLEIFPDGSGFAQFSHNFGRMKQAIVAGAGPLGPTIAGVILIISSTRKGATEIMMYILSAMLVISTLLWVRPWFGFGFFITIGFAIVFTLIARKGNLSVKRFTLQFIGVQAMASVYVSIGYLFSTGGTIAGSSFSSDTQVMAQNLWLPHWLWGFIILAISVVSFYKSLKYASKY